VKIVALENLGIYRDGGSVSASFSGDDARTYCLFFGIKRRQTKEQPPGYRSPVLQSFTPSEYRSPVTGDVSPMWIEDSKSVTWQEARAILEEISGYMAAFKSDYLWVYQEMVEAAAMNGR
jgi:hypothetical protein